MTESGNSGNGDILGNGTDKFSSPAKSMSSWYRCLYRYCRYC